MRVPVILLACLSCVAAFPAFFFPFTSGGGLSWMKGLVECRPSAYGYDLPKRCREKNEQEVEPAKLIVQDLIYGGGDEDDLTIVTVVEDEHAGPFAIRVPEQIEYDAPKCAHHDEIFVPELGICMKHQEPKELRDKPHGEKEKEKRVKEKHPPVTILEVGTFEKEECGPHEIWVPEVGICLEY